MANNKKCVSWAANPYFVGFLAFALATAALITAGLSVAEHVHANEAPYMEQAHADGSLVESLTTNLRDVPNYEMASHFLTWGLAGGSILLGLLTFWLAGKENTSSQLFLAAIFIMCFGASIVPGADFDFINGTEVTQAGLEDYIAQLSVSGGLGLIVAGGSAYQRWRENKKGQQQAPAFRELAEEVASRTKTLPQPALPQTLAAIHNIADGGDASHFAAADTRGRTETDECGTFMIGKPPSIKKPCPLETGLDDVHFAMKRYTAARGFARERPTPTKVSKKTDQKEANAQTQTTQPNADVKDGALEI